MSSGPMLSVMKMSRTTCRNKACGASIVRQQTPPDVPASGDPQAPYCSGRVTGPFAALPWCFAFWPHATKNQQRQSAVRFYSVFFRGWVGLGGTGGCSDTLSTLPTPRLRRRSCILSRKRDGFAAGLGCFWENPLSEFSAPSSLGFCRVHVRGSGHSGSAGARARSLSSFMPVYLSVAPSRRCACFR